MNDLTSDDHVEYIPLTQEEKDIRALQDNPVFLRESLELVLAELWTSRDRFVVLEQAALAVVQRWETPLWKDAEPTAAVIARLRDAIGP